jgi:hypothetical protein
MSEKPPAPAPKCIMWALVFDSRIIPETVRPTKREAWEVGYLVVDYFDPEFGKKYWKKWEPSIRAAAKLGYTLQRVAVALGVPK